jgi:hypothetical protein
MLLGACLYQPDFEAWNIVMKFSRASCDQMGKMLSPNQARELYNDEDGARRLAPLYGQATAQSHCSIEVRFAKP